MSTRKIRIVSCSVGFDEPQDHFDADDDDDDHEEDFFLEVPGYSFTLRIDVSETQRPPSNYSCHSRFGDEVDAYFCTLLLPFDAASSVEIAIGQVLQLL